MSFPGLWTSIVLSNAIWIREAAMLNYQLDRSGNAPLNILIRFTQNYYEDNDDEESDKEEEESTLDMWRTVRFQFDWGVNPPRAFIKLKALPLLSEVVFSGRSQPPPVVLSNVDNISSPNVLLPWDRITTYKATYYVDGLTHFKNLSAAVNLVECDIGFANDPVAD
ncbi:hypothetical protein C8R43DRAFT_1156334 [Mycena crocata]|nr:hypothetical protein C8R43DRAFT_1156334 [Mycena crocata]